MGFLVWRMVLILSRSHMWVLGQTWSGHGTCEYTGAHARARVCVCVCMLVHVCMLVYLLHLEA
jgi:hypothetical protein